MNLLHHTKDIVTIALNHRVIFKVFRFLLAEFEEWHPCNADGILKRTKRSLLDKTLLNSTQKRFLLLGICLFELFEFISICSVHPREQVWRVQPCLGIKPRVVGRMLPSLAHKSLHNCILERLFFMVGIADHLYNPVSFKLCRGPALWLGQLFHFVQRLFGHK